MKICRKVRFLVVFILLLTVFYSSLNLIPRANPLPVNSGNWKFWRHIGLLPLADSNISMADANVTLDIDATEYLNFEIITETDYIFYNHNQTVTLTVVIPYDSISNFEGPINDVNDVIDVKVNGDFQEFVEYELNEDQYDYLQNLVYISLPEPTTVIATNITFEGYSNTSLSYSSQTILKRSNHNTYVQIFYLVSTGLVWYGNISETVKFNVCGLQPDSVEYCLVSDIENGKEYLWEWPNDRYDYYVDPTITYTSADPRFFEIFGAYIIIGALTILITVISVAVRYFMRKRRL